MHTKDAANPLAVRKTQRRLANRRGEAMIVPMPQEPASATQLGVSLRRRQQGLAMMEAVLARRSCVSGLCCAVRWFKFWRSTDSLSRAGVWEAWAVFTCQVQNAVAVRASNHGVNWAKRRCKDAFFCLESPAVTYVLALIALVGVSRTTMWEVHDAGDNFRKLAYVAFNRARRRLSHGLRVEPGPEPGSEPGPEPGPEPGSGAAPEATPEDAPATGGNRRLLQVLFDVGTVETTLEAYLGASFHRSPMAYPKMLAHAMWVIRTPELMVRPRMATLACGIMLAVFDEDAKQLLPMHCVEHVCRALRVHVAVPEAHFSMLAVLESMGRWTAAIYRFLLRLAAKKGMAADCPGVFRAAVDEFMALPEGARFELAGAPAHGCAHGAPADADVDVDVDVSTAVGGDEEVPGGYDDEDMEDETTLMPGKEVTCIQQVYAHRRVIDSLESVATEVVQVLGMQDVCSAGSALGIIATLLHHKRTASWVHLVPEVAAHIRRWVVAPECVAHIARILAEAAVCHAAAVPGMAPLVTEEMQGIATDLKEAAKLADAAADVSTEDSATTEP